MTRISFISDNYKFAGNLFVTTQPRDVAFLFIQGWTGHQNVSAAQILTGQDHTTMTYDMRGNGESEGNLAEFTRADFIQDAVAAYDYLREQVSDDTKIGVIGSSFGSYTAALLSQERGVYCLSLRVPANYPDEGFTEPQLAQGDPEAFRKWRMERLTYNDNRALNALHNFRGAVQIIEAEKDELVPGQTPRNYAEAMASKEQLTYEVVPNAPHRLRTKQLQSDYEKRLTAWIAKL